MKKYFIIFLTVSLAVFLISCDDSTSKKSGITPITPAETETTYILKATVEGYEIEQFNRTVYVKSIDDIYPGIGLDNIYCIYSDSACTSQLLGNYDIFAIGFYEEQNGNFVICPNLITETAPTSNTNWICTELGQSYGKINIKKGNYSFVIGEGTLSIEVPKDITNLICSHMSGY